MRGPRPRKNIWPPQPKIKKGENPGPEISGLGSRMSKKYDNVNKPKHYNRENAMESIDEMVLVFGVEAVKNFCLCNVWKYRYRATEKNGEEDLKKSDWYMRKYRELCNTTITTTTDTLLSPTITVINKEQTPLEPDPWPPKIWYENQPIDLTTTPLDVKPNWKWNCGQAVQTTVTPNTDITTTTNTIDKP